MNKKGSLFVSIIIAGMLFMSGMILLNYLKTEVSTTTSSAGLNCDSASTISDGVKLTCLLTDSVIPVYILSVVSIAGGIVIGKQ